MVVQYGMLYNLPSFPDHALNTNWTRNVQTSQRSSAFRIYLVGVYSCVYCTVMCEWTLITSPRRLLSMCFVSMHSTCDHFTGASDNLHDWRIVFSLKEIRYAGALYKFIDRINVLLLPHKLPPPSPSRAPCDKQSCGKYMPCTC